MKTIVYQIALFLLSSAAILAQTVPGVAVINYSGFNANAPIAPGSIASAFGAFGSAATAVAGSLDPLPTTLSNLSVRIGTRVAPLYFVSATQINFIIPVDTPNGQQTVEVLNGTTVSNRGTIQVWETFPALASSDTTRFSQAIAQNQDFSINTQTQRARRGQIIQLYATGCGRTTPASPDGRPPAALSPAAATVTSTIAGLTLPVQFAGAHPQFPGICQVNATIPNQPFVTGQVNVFISVNGIASNPVSIWVE